MQPINTQNPKFNSEEERIEWFKAFMENHKKVKALGFAGVLSNGNMVDRREHPDAIPLAYNPYMNIPKPHPMPNLKEARESLKNMGFDESRLIWDEKDQRWAVDIK